MSLSSSAKLLTNPRCCAGVAARGVQFAPGLWEDRENSGGGREKKGEKRTKEVQTKSWLGWPVEL